MLAERRILIKMKSLALHLSGNISMFLHTLPISIYCRKLKHRTGMDGYNYTVIFNEKLSLRSRKKTDMYFPNISSLPGILS